MVLAERDGIAMMAAYCGEGKLVGGRKKKLGTNKSRENGDMLFILFFVLYLTRRKFGVQKTLQCHGSALPLLFANAANHNQTLNVLVPNADACIDKGHHPKNTTNRYFYSWGALTHSDRKLGTNQE
jgi:hypothetical protein